MKERLFGAFIVIALFVIFLPMVLKKPQPDTIEVAVKPEPSIDLSESALKPPEPLAQWHAQAEQASHDRAKQAWVLQLATFANRNNAQKLVNKLSTQGYHAYLEGVPGHENSLTWVLVGPVEERSQVEDMRAAFKDAFKMEGLVVPFENHS